MGKQKISFEEFYGDLYGERWPLLREALRAEPAYFELRPFAEGENRPEQSSGKEEKSYFLDEASYRTALLLNPGETDSILDMCAAPGGKSLSLLASWPGISLTANEWSSRRRERLRRVLTEHLSAAQLSRIRVTGYDALTWFRREQEAYDGILLDVPCSSERHVLNSPRHLQEWSESRTKRLSTQAFAMLASALELVRKGGRILYSTCALSPVENDGVLEKLHLKRAGRFKLLPVHLPFGEQTMDGWQVMPDTAQGRGPMYAAMVERLS
jgi:16S rRNA C967 or C1407 C5-methylase (RsmB/RsmF family)